MAVIAIGAGCNLAAIVANGGFMPADPAAMASIGGLPPGYINSDIVEHAALLPLTDQFALPSWLPFANVFSVGDVLIGVGVAATIASRDAGETGVGRGRPGRLTRGWKADLVADPSHRRPVRPTLTVRWKAIEQSQRHRPV